MDIQSYRHEIIEAELSEAQREALDEACVLLGVRRDAWFTCPPLRLTYESLAAVALTLKIIDDVGLAWTGALLRACILLDLNYETVRKRLGIWRQADRNLPDSR